MTLCIGGVWDPGAVRLQMPRRGAVVESQVEQVLNLGNVCWIGDRNQHFHPAVEVAVHQVRRSDANRRRPIVGKPEQAAVLQETAQNAANPDVLAEPWHAWANR